MIIVTYLRTATFFYQRLYLFSSMASSIFFTFSILYTLVIFSILSIPLTALILYSPTFGTKGTTLWGWCIWETWILGTGSNNVTGIFLSKRFSSKRVSELPFELSVLHNPLSISFGQCGAPSQSRNFVSKLSIKSSKVSLYLLKIAAISNFPFALLTACLSTHFQRIATIQFWPRKRILAQIFLRQALRLCETDS